MSTPHPSEILAMCEAWGVPPYELEKNLTPYWYNRWAIMRDEVTQFQERQRKRAEQKAKRK